MSGLSHVMRGLYSVIWNLNLDPDSGSRHPKSISLVVMGREHGPVLSVCLYGLSVSSLQLVALVSRLFMHKTSPTISLVCILFTSFLDVYHLFGGFLTNYAFLCLFFYVSTTFTTDPRVVGLVAGST